MVLDPTLTIALLEKIKAEASIEHTLTNETLRIHGYLDSIVLSHLSGLRRQGVIIATVLYVDSEPSWMVAGLTWYGEHYLRQLKLGGTSPLRS